MTASGKIHMCPLLENWFARTFLPREIDLPSVFSRADVFEVQDSTVYTKWELLERPYGVCTWQNEQRKRPQKTMKLPCFRIFVLFLVLGLGSRWHGLAFFLVSKFKWSVSEVWFDPRSGKSQPIWWTSKIVVATLPYHSRQWVYQAPSGCFRTFVCDQTLILSSGRGNYSGLSLDYEKQRGRTELGYNWPISIIQR